MLPVHPARAAPRHRPSAGCSGEGEGGCRRPGGPAVAAAAPLAATQQFTAAPDRGQGRAVRGGGRGEEGQRRGVHRGQLVLPHHRRIHRRQGIRTKKRRGMGLFVFLNIISSTCHPSVCVRVSHGVILTHPVDHTQCLPVGHGRLDGV